jgi:hypothetical protein
VICGAVTITIPPLTATVSGGGWHPRHEAVRILAADHLARIYDDSYFRGGSAGYMLGTMWTSKLFLF